MAFNDDILNDRCLHPGHYQWQYLDDSSRKAGSRPNALSYSGTMLEQRGVEAMTSAPPESPQEPQPAEPHAKALKSPRQITEHTHVSLGIKPIFPLKDLVCME